MTRPEDSQMIKKQPQGGHSDLAPSSKDWASQSSGDDSDYTPQKDLWARSHPKQGEPEPDFGVRSQAPGRDVADGQPKSRVDDVRRPDPEDEDEKLDEALQESFPASDPPAAAHPGVTGWDVENEAMKRGGGKR
jgi:hypothetical protein